VQEVVIVSDFFSTELVGGAELTTAALEESSPFNLIRVKSQDVTAHLLQEHHGKHWVFGNWALLDKNLLPTIIANMSYSVLEYDYKFCKYRSPEKHATAEGVQCDCHEQPIGKITAAFYFGARTLWWMSERQQSRYLERFPLLKERPGSVLSSVFSESFWTRLRELRLESKNSQRSKWLVLGSGSWIKGTDEAIQWCKDNKKEYEVLSGISPDEVLNRMSTAEGFVYLPKGGDTCPRMVIEAKLLGCKLHLNDNVEHGAEDWFNAPDQIDTESYLYAARETFWNGVRAGMEWRPTISGYTTVYNAESMGYPWRDCVSSMLAFCDEVVVLDGGSNDGSWEALVAWSQSEPKIRAHQHVIDFESPGFAYESDGLQKARSRDLCTKEFCWQMDADEVVPAEDGAKVTALCRRLTQEVELVSLPVIEYWGSKERVRVDVNPWKWRLSRNRKHITHGIPAFLRRTTTDGRIHAAPGTDGCDYINRKNGELIPHVSFYTEEAHNARLWALRGDKEALRDYEKWLQMNVDALPSVIHYSWLDIGKKIRNYSKYWSKFWQSLYNVKQEDTVENNMFFDKPWSEVTDDEITSLAKRLADETGGHVFHEKIDWTKPNPFIKIVK
jgi:glycosyltransferase involved in cell wall biosynthesis